MFKVKDGLKVGTVAVIDSNGNILTNAATASALASQRTLSITGVITGSVSTDFSGTTTISTTLANTTVVPGTYTSITVGADGRITAGTNPTTLGQYGITDAQPLDGTLTAVAGTSWSSGTQVLAFTGADTASLITVGQASGNILNKAAGDALYATVGHNHNSTYQPLDGTLTALAGLSWASGSQVPVFTGTDTVSFLTVGTSSANLLIRSGADTLYATTGHNHNATYQPLDATLTAMAGLSWSSGTQIPVFTAADTTSFLTVGSGTGNILNKAAGDVLYMGLGGGTFTGAVTLWGDPTNPLHAATKQYVDNAIQGISPKLSVRAATTTNITLSGAQTIDGVSVIAGDRVLVKNQSSAAQNGIYVAAAGSWTRAADADAWSDLVSAFTFVQEGTQQGDTGWTSINDAGGTLGTTAVTWTQFSGSATFTASNGIIKNGIDFQLTGEALAVHNISGTGFVRRTGVATWSASSLSNSEVITALGYTPFHAGNDGAASGLDADLLDGQHGAYYLDSTNLTGTLPAGRLPAFTGDITTSAGSSATTLATVNSNVGSFGSATQVATFTVNAKGLTTAASNVTITPAWSSITSKPTTISGFGITDAVTTSGNQTVAGDKTVTGNTYLQRPFQYAAGVPSNNLGSPSITEMALFDSQFNNKTWFYDPTKLSFEYTMNGTDWIDPAYVTAQKQMFLGSSITNSSAITIPNNAVKYRITVRNGGNYVYLNALYFYWSGNGNSTQVHVYKKRDDDGIWVQHTNSTAAISSWPGHLYMPFQGIPWSTASTAGHYAEVRIEFIPTTWANSNPINLYFMELWGGYPAGNRQIFSWDHLKNVTFPATVSAATSNAALMTATTANATTINATTLNSVTGAFTGNVAISGVVSSTNNNNADGPNFKVNTTNKTTAEYAYLVQRSGSNVGGILLDGKGAFASGTTINGNTAWHAGNDGAASGLDSDLLDGQEGSYYLNAANLTGTLSASRLPAFTGDVTTSAGASATTLATVNSNVGSFGSATQVATFTVNAKGLTTAAANVTITPAWSSITSKPTTVSGYGITDTYSTTSNIALGLGKTVYDTSTGTSNGFVVHNVASYKSSSSTLTGALVFYSPNGSTPNVMHDFDVQIYNHTGTHFIAFSASAYSYNNASTAIVNPRVTHRGNNRVSVRFGYDSGGKFCLIIGDVGGTWSYPHAAITRAMFSQSANAAYCTGWTSAVVTDLTGYTQVTADLSPSDLSFAKTATILETARTIGMTGDVTWTSASFNGSGNVTGTSTLATVNSNVGSFGSATQVAVLTLNAKGLVTAASNATITPAWSSITSKPTTVSGYGITDAVKTVNGVAPDGAGNVSVGAGTPFTTYWTGDGTTTTFDLGTTVAAGTIVVAVNGVLQKPTTHYTISGTNLVFNTAPLNGADVSARLLGTYIIDGTNLNDLMAGKADSTLFPDGSRRSMRAVDIRNLTNPTTGLGYSAGGRFRFSSLNDDSSSPYADVIDLSTYADSSGGGFNALYLGKNSQTIVHKYAAAAATSWTSKTLAYTDSNITGSAATLTTGRTIGMTGDVTWTSASFNGSGNVTGTSTLATVNSNVGSFGSATQVAVLTVNAKGLVTAASNTTITPAWSSITSKPTTISGYGITDAVSSTTTSLGLTGNLSADAATDTAAEWSALPVGYSRMMNTSIGTAGGAPVANYGYFNKTANRDTGGGWAGMWVGYTAGQNYFGRSGDSSTLATWEKIWTEANDGTGSGLDADLLDGMNSNQSSATANTIVARSATGSIIATDLTTPSGNGNGVKMWGGDIRYSMVMSQATDATYGGRMSGDSTSDYNIYFRMADGTNRGWVFRNTTTMLAGIDGAGNIRALGAITGSNLSGTNTGDQTTITGNAGSATILQTGRTIAMTGDVTWTSPSFNGSGNVTGTSTLATVNSNVGSFGSATEVATFTVNAKGLTTAASNVTITPAWSSITSKPTTLSGYSITVATGSDFRTGTDNTKPVTVQSLYDAVEFVTLTYGTTVTPDFATGQNFSLTLTGNCTLGAPTNTKEGMSGTIEVKQDATGSRTLAYNTAWKFAGGAPTLPTTANSITLITYLVRTEGGSPILYCNMAKSFS